MLRMQLVDVQRPTLLREIITACVSEVTDKYNKVMVGRKKKKKNLV